MERIPTYPVQGSEHLPFLVVAVVALVALAVLVSTPLRALVARRQGRPRPGVFVPAVFLLAALVGGVASVRPWQWDVPRTADVGRRWHPDTLWYARTDGLPALLDGAALVERLGDRPVRIAAGGGPHTGVISGQPVNPVDADTPRHHVHMYGYGVTLQDPGPYPIPDRVLQQGFPLGAWDTKVMMIDAEAGRTYELATARRVFGRWWALASAVWDPSDPSLDKPGYTTASKLPSLPGKVHPDEIESGTVDHLLWGVAPALSETALRWPAQGTDGRNPAPGAVPMGTVLRLRADYPIEDLPPQARVVARALQEYGMLLADSGPELVIGAISDPRWDEQQLAAFSRITTADLEAVSLETLRVEDRSMLVDPPGGVPAAPG